MTRAMGVRAPSGIWTTDAPLTPEQVTEDMALLRTVVIPDGVQINTAEVYVNGRLWYWENLGASFADIRREANL